ncbi:uncharacterized protein [Hetaerina americana]|uniref:uncharacterized protein n=1 Tax=Hetaerina americana TaxID=62018 RepID=UPI003A7F2B49
MAPKSIHSLWLVSVLLLCLHLCGCSGNSGKERIWLEESTFRRMGTPVPRQPLDEKSLQFPAKHRSPPSPHAPAAKGGDLLHWNPRLRPDDEIPAGGRSPRQTKHNDDFGVFPKAGTVCIGEDIIIVYRMQPEDGPVVNCTLLTINGSSVQLYPPPPGQKQQQSEDSRIVYYDSGIEGTRCGFRIRGALLSDYGGWELFAATKNVKRSERVGISVFDCSWNGSNARHEFLPGKDSTSTCGPEKLKTCYITAPGDHGVPERPTAIQVESCKTPKVNFSNLVVGDWTCEWTSSGSMVPRTSKVDLEYAAVPSDQDVGFVWRNTSSPSGRSKPALNLHCNYLANAVVDVCKFVMPGGGTLYPRDGLASGRYSYFGRGLKNGDCGLSVEQPLKPQEIGLWRCEAYISSVDPWALRGGFLEVGIASRTREEKLKTLRTWIPRKNTIRSTTDNLGDEVEMEVMSGDSLVIGCSADAPLTLCLIRLPDGNATVPPRIATSGAPFQPYGRGERLGDCGLQVQAATTSEHSGKWECVVSIDYGDAVALPIRTHVHEKQLVAEVKGDVSRGYPAEFRCRSVMGVALEHCRFERPDYSIVTVIDSRHPDVHRTSWRHGVRAVGDLGAGFCAVSIPSIRAEDVGEWTCVAKAQDSAEDIHIRFQVVEKGISVATVATVSAVVVIIAAVGGAAGWRWYVRKRGLLHGSTNQDVARDDSIISFRRGAEEDAGSSAS